MIVPRSTPISIGVSQVSVRADHVSLKGIR